MSIIFEKETINSVVKDSGAEGMFDDFNKVAGIPKTEHDENNLHSGAVLVSLSCNEPSKGVVYIFQDGSDFISLKEPQLSQLIEALQKARDLLN